MKIVVSLTALAAALVALFDPTNLRAEIVVIVRGPEAWVSIGGTDSNSCGRMDPCRNLRRAIDVTSDRGTVSVLDSGNFGPVVIDRSLSIVNAGPGVAIITTPSAEGAIRIRTSVGERVFLRGLTIDGGAAGNAGILFEGGGALHVQNSVIKNFHAVGSGGLPPYGIRVSATSELELYVSDTLVAGNGVATTGGGVLIQPSSDTPSKFITKAVFDRVQVEGNSVGIEADGTRIRPGDRRTHVQVVVRDSVVAGSPGHGVRAHSTSLTAAPGAFTAITIDRSSSVNNGRGVTVDGGKATIRVADSTIAGNGTGLFATNGGRLDYSNNNSITGNDTNVDEPPSGL